MKKSYRRVAERQPKTDATNHLREAYNLRHGMTAEDRRVLAGEMRWMAAQLIGTQPVACKTANSLRIG